MRRCAMRSSAIMPDHRSESVFRPYRAVAIDPLHECIERGLRLACARVVDDRYDDEATARRVDDIARDRANALQRAGLEQRLAGDAAVLESARERAVHRGDGERALELVAHRAPIGSEQQLREPAGADPLMARQ